MPLLAFLFFFQYRNCGIRLPLPENDVLFMSKNLKSPKNSILKFYSFCPCRNYSFRLEIREIKPILLVVFSGVIIDIYYLYILKTDKNVKKYWEKFEPDEMAQNNQKCKFPKKREVLWKNSILKDLKIKDFKQKRKILNHMACHSYVG